MAILICVGTYKQTCTLVTPEGALINGVTLFMLIEFSERPHHSTLAFLWEMMLLRE